MRISDWSSDVCSSDLTQVQTPLAYLFRIASNLMADRARAQRRAPTLEWDDDDGWDDQACAAPDQESGLLFADLERSYAAALDERSEERRVGKECVSTCRSRWWPYPSKKKPVQIK